MFLWVWCACINSGAQAVSHHRKRPGNEANIIHVWTSLTDKGIGSLGRIVEELCLVRLKKVKGEGLKGLMSRSLKQLTLQEIYEVTDSSVCALVRNCPNVEKLTLVDLDRVSDASFVCLAEVLREKLVSLNVCVRVGVWYL